MLLQCAMKMFAAIYVINAVVVVANAIAVVVIMQ